MIRAAIDIGTVTTRLLIGHVRKQGIDTLGYSHCITDLGEGLASSKIISEAAYERLVEALDEFSELIAKTKARLSAESGGEVTVFVKAVATSAMRDAANSEDVLARLAERGYDVEVISGQREAELSFVGTLSGFTELSDRVLSIDVGGGSTEIILGTRDGGIEFAHSFDIGSRRVTDLFLRDDPPGAEQMQAARGWIEAQTRTLIETLPARPKEVLAVAGTATTAVTIRDKIVVYDKNRVHKTRVYLSQLEAIILQLSELKLSERAKIPGLEPGRAPVIIGGLLTLSTLLKTLNFDSLTVSDTDILQGIILS